MTYRTLKARAVRASMSLDHAESILSATLPDEPTWAEDRAVMDAHDIFRAAGKRIWIEVDEARKSEGIGDYIPYGRKTQRRF